MPSSMPHSGILLSDAGISLRPSRPLRCENQILTGPHAHRSPLGSCYWLLADPSLTNIGLSPFTHGSYPAAKASRSAVLGWLYVQKTTKGLGSGTSSHISPRSWNERTVVACASGTSPWITSCPYTSAWCSSHRLKALPSGSARKTSTVTTSNSNPTEAQSSTP